MGESNRAIDELYEMHLLLRRLFAGRSVSRATSLLTVAALLAACSGSGGQRGWRLWRRRTAASDR